MKGRKAYFFRCIQAAAISGALLFSIPVYAARNLTGSFSSENDQQQDGWEEVELDDLTIRIPTDEILDNYVVETESGQIYVYGETGPRVCTMNVVKIPELTAFSLDPPGELCSIYVDWKETELMDLIKNNRGVSDVRFSPCRQCQLDGVPGMRFSVTCAMDRYMFNEDFRIPFYDTMIFLCDENTGGYLLDFKVSCDKMYQVPLDQEMKELEETFISSLHWKETIHPEEKYDPGWEGDLQEILYASGVELFQSGDYKKAENQFRLALAPGNYKDAESYMQKCSEKTGNNMLSERLYQEALRAYEEGDYRTAENSFRFLALINYDGAWEKRLLCIEKMGLLSGYLEPEKNGTDSGQDSMKGWG